MFNTLLRGKFIKRARVSKPNKLGAWEFFNDLVFAPEYRQPALGQVEYVVTVSDFDVCQFRMDGRGHV